MTVLFSDKSAEVWLPRVYERLVDALRSVRSECPTIPVLSVLWMHPKHPIHQVQERLMRPDSEKSARLQASAGKGLRGLLMRMAESSSRIARLTVCAANAARLCLKLSFLQRAERRRIESVRRQTFDVVAKTWCFGLQRPAGEDDFYYGDLQKRLERRGHRMLLLSGDSAEANWSKFTDAQFSDPNLTRIPEMCLVPAWAPLKMLWMQFRSSLILGKLASKAQDALTRKIAHAASMDVLSPAVTQTGLSYWIGEQVVRTWRPRALVTLYEGHGWEKCMWWGARNEDPRCLIVGYQHTVVFPEAYDLTRPFVDMRERSIPDVVLALGKRTCELMRDGHERHQSRVVPFGTFRYKAHNPCGPAPVDRRHVIVIPEGIPIEIKTLFTFAHECGRLLPSHTFVLRSHPQWPIAKALDELELDVLRLPNVVVSNNREIDEDFSRSSIVLYSGSSAVLYGLLAGLLPVYVRSEERLDSDPLYALESWRRVCATPAEFAGIVREYEAMPLIKRDAEWQTAACYVSEYTVPVDDRSVDAFLAEIRL